MRGIRRAVLAVAGLAMVAAISIGFPVAATAASACYTANGCPTTTVPGQVPKAPDAPPTTVDGPPTTVDAPPTTADGPTLAFTGTDVIELVALAGAAVLGGALLVRASRRRKST